MRIPHKLNAILKSEFLRNTSTLVSGVALAQLIPILIQPILRRYYSAELFGSYAVYISLIGIMYVVTSLRYEQAIIVPKDNSEAAEVLTISQLLNLFISSLLLLAVFIFNKPLLSFLNIPEKHKIFLYAFPLGTFLFNLHQGITLWLIRQKAFINVSANKLVRRGSEGAFQLSFRYLKVNMGLLIGDLIGHVVNIAYGVILIFKRGFSLKNIQFKKLYITSKKYSDYPKYNTITSFISALSALLPVIVINKFYGSEYTAFFDLSRMLLLTPIALLAGSLSNVMLQRISEKKHKMEFFGKELKLILLIGLGIALAELLIILLFGEQLFALLFGKSWQYSGTISKLLVWPYIIHFFTFSFTSVFLALQKIKLLSIFQAINSMLIFSLFFFKSLEFGSFLNILITLNIFSGIVFSGFLFKVVYSYYKETIAS